MFNLPPLCRPQDRPTPTTAEPSAPKPSNDGRRGYLNERFDALAADLMADLREVRRDPQASDALRTVAFEASCQLLDLLGHLVELEQLGPPEDPDR